MQRWKYPFALLGIAFALVGYAFWPRQQHVPVIVYHDIQDQTRAGNYVVSTQLLSLEIDYLLAHGYTPLTFSAAATLYENHKLPKKPVILSFDDAFEGQYANALPLLKSKHVPATFFIPSGWVGDNGRLAWNQVLEISNAGMEIGGHTLHHAHLLDESDAQLADEIGSDKNAIESELGRAVNAFAYPYGEHDARIMAAVEKAGYTVSRTSSSSAPVVDDGHAMFGGSVVTNSFDSFLNALR